MLKKRLAALEMRAEGKQNKEISEKTGFHTQYIIHGILHCRHYRGSYALVHAQNAVGSIHLCFRSRRHGRLQTHIPLQREKFPVKKTLPHRNILISLFGSLLIFHVQRRSRLDYVAYCRCCPTIIYIDSHSASIQERRKISYSQPLPCRAP